MVCRGSAYASSNGEFNSTKFLKHPSVLKKKKIIVPYIELILPEVNYPYESPAEG
jgi:hypothetical protein